ncbi:MAG: hypothetical protein ACRDSH_00250 [Pseudonocardiaceae bacterium]
MSSDAAGPEHDPWAALEQAARKQQALEQAAREGGSLHSLTTPPGPPGGKTKAGKRERIVLAQRRSSRRVVRTLAELEDQTGVGEVLVRQLVQVQWRLSVRLMLITVLVLASIPVTFWLVPSLGTITIVGMRLPWLLLGLAVYPFFVAVAWSYNRSVERKEQDFADIVES